MKTHLLLFISFSIFLTSCAPLMTAQEIGQQTNDYLCRFAREKPLPYSADKINPVIWDELLRRKLIAPEEQRRVLNGEIIVGMSQCELYAAWGNPSYEREHISNLGTLIQHEYRQVGYYTNTSTYVYTLNGKITSWSGSR